MSQKSDFKILAVDDEKDILVLLKYNLETEGYFIETANSGKEAIKIAEKIEPNLILLDIMMPGMDGIETCINLRKIEKLSSSSILFLTARSEEYSEVAAFDAGADDYIIKPIKPRALISRINSFYKKKFISELNTVIKVGNLLIDKESHVVKFDDDEIFFPKAKQIFSDFCLISENFRNFDFHFFEKHIFEHQK